MRAGWLAVQASPCSPPSACTWAGKRWNSWTVLEDPHVFVDAIRAVPSQPDRVALAVIGTIAFSIAFSIAYRMLTGARAEQPG